MSDETDRPPYFCGCGAEIETKNAAGQYREQCWECIESAATLGDSSNPFRELADAERAAGTLTTRVGESL
jgi:hypothetical protein